MAADGSNQRRPSTEFVQICDWSPDGDYLVFEGHGGLGLLTADGSASGSIPVSVVERVFPDWTE